ncbi:MAG: H+/Na+-translocating ferredoxin:NAD+ oxidoreductase subunit [Thermodesulfobacteriota bacterium]|nr:H+/Na+-translocating ferredoxin:NAD+ oxidoreductase subunit [Thermodesulfobacteriota bacterium]
MPDQKLYLVSYAPYWHNGSSVRARSYDYILAALPAVFMGILQYGVPAFRVVAFSVSCAVLWELLLNKAMKKPVTIVDGNAAVIGLLLAMMLPATAPWWAVLIGALAAILVGKWVYGGLGCNPLNPPMVAFAMLMLSWKGVVDFNAALVNFDLGFDMAYPPASLKYFGASAVEDFTVWGLLMGRQSGGIGTTFGLGLIAGGLYLILRGHVRWEIPASFIAGILITASLFHVSDPARYGAPIFHLLTGSTLLAAFFLIGEDSSSPVNRIPMFLYGALGGFLTVLIRSIGIYPDGVVFAVLLINICNPLLDKIRPKAFGKGAQDA